MLIDYFGSTDNAYTKEAIRKQLVGSVARVINPGCKFDLVLVLVGKQGTYKSTFINTLGKSWYSDTFLTVQGTQALEQIQGVWLMEMAELAGLRKADAEAVKHFISKQVDSFRAAYGKATESHKRQTTFWGTTNKWDFLTDASGNRRFNPIDVVPERITKNVFTDLPDEVDQVWAEAVQLYKDKEPLYLSSEAQTIAKAEQRQHSETDDRTGIIENYLDTLLPDGWDKLDDSEPPS